GRRSSVEGKSISYLQDQNLDLKRPEFKIGNTVKNFVEEQDLTTLDNAITVPVLSDKKINLSAVLKALSDNLANENLFKYASGMPNISERIKDVVYVNDKFSASNENDKWILRNEAFLHELVEQWYYKWLADNKLFDFDAVKDLEIKDKRVDLETQTIRIQFLIGYLMFGVEGLEQMHSAYVLNGDKLLKGNSNKFVYIEVLEKYINLLRELEAKGNKRPDSLSSVTQDFVNKVVNNALDKITDDIRTSVASVVRA
ncbi:hypothetical protein KKC59_00720, partial [bacterium]|nr:hypothetical protein [bacterium]